MLDLAVEAFAPDMAQFKRGRDFAAWLGLVPRQHSSGGKERLGRVSKAGQRDIRRLLIIGAMSRLNRLGRRTILQGSWLAKIPARKPKMLVAIALANKMARQLWAMVTKNEDYRDPALAAGVSEGALMNMFIRARPRFGIEAGKAKATLRAARVVASDETGVRIEGANS